MNNEARSPNEILKWTDLLMHPLGMSSSFMVRLSFKACGQFPNSKGSLNLQAAELADSFEVLLFHRGDGKPVAAPEDEEVGQFGIFAQLR